MSKRVVSVSVVPGGPLDGTGRVCIHLFVQDTRGPFVEPHALHRVLDAEGNPVKRQLVAKPTRGRLACNPRRSVAPVTRDGVTIITSRTDDPRAVTCPYCIASADYTRMMEALEPKQVVVE